LSRNRTVGIKLGQGMKLADVIESMHGAVAEGVLTSRAAHDLAKKLGVEAPIIDGIYKVIHGKCDSFTVRVAA
jgi:glycerol-3-phosphate dehydrogenase (NAD(P)+)